MKTIVIDNRSSQQKTVKISTFRGTDETSIPLCSTVTIKMGSNFTIEGSSVNFDGTITKRSLSIGNVSKIDRIYLLENSIGTNLTVTEGQLINTSDRPILFIEIGDKGRRWPKAMVVPRAKISGVALGSFSFWQAVDPQAEDIIIAHTKLGTKPQSLTFESVQTYSGRLY
jgi:hypothetical protein